MCTKSGAFWHAEKLKVFRAQHKKLIAALALLLAFSFLGIPVPDWLSAAVNSLSGIIMAVVAGLSKLAAFIQLFVRF